MTDPELVLVLADVDAERFLCSLIERGIERKCLRSFEWTHVRDPMRDAHLAQQPLVAAGPFLFQPNGVRFLVVWDHQGSGREDQPPSSVEKDVVDHFVRADIDRSRVAAISFEPELESVLMPVWDRVLNELATKRSQLPCAVAFDTSHPKQSLTEVLKIHRLRSQPALFTELGGKLSLEQLKKGEALKRIAQHLLDWFGAD